MLEKYETHLNKITDEITSYFDEQKDYIKCKQGCSICCSNSYYPITELEYSYIKKGLESFFKEDIESLQKKALEIYRQRREFLKTHSDIKDFEYVCPFLKDNLCCVYNYRPLICRSHGLIISDCSETPPKRYMPYCVHHELNYANVYDTKEKSFSDDKINSLGYKTLPKAYDVSCSSLMGSCEDVNFGDVRMIYEWIIMDIPNYKIIMQNISDNN